MDQHDKVLALANSTKYPIYQENGQRIFGPPPGWVGPPPPRGSEVFVSSLPRDCFEDELVPLFESVGPIYMLRLMMDFSGTNRGFCYVQYTSPEITQMAIKMLNGYEIRGHRKLKVDPSVDNCRLFIGKIPKGCNREDVLNAMPPNIENIKDVYLYLSLTDKTQNRGFCFIEFENHRSAAVARRILITNGVQIWGKEIRVDWAIPEPEVDVNIMNKVTVLFIRNMMLKTNVDTLRTTVLQFVSETEVTRIRKLRDFAFVHFTTREAAERALLCLNGYSIDGAVIEVQWAKPQNPEERKFTDDTKFRRKLEKKVLKLMSVNGDCGEDPSLNGGPKFRSNRTRLNGRMPNSDHSLEGENTHISEFPYQYVQGPTSHIPGGLMYCVPNELQGVVWTILNECRPAVALEKISNILALGCVDFDMQIFFQGGGMSYPLFMATVVLSNGNQAIGYPDTSSPAVNAPDVAKDNAAFTFLKNLLF